MASDQMPPPVVLVGSGSPPGEPVATTVVGSVQSASNATEAEPPPWFNTALVRIEEVLVKVLHGSSSQLEQQAFAIGEIRECLGVLVERQEAADKVGDRSKVVTQVFGGLSGGVKKPATNSTSLTTFRQNNMDGSQRSMAGVSDLNNNSSGTGSMNLSVQSVGLSSKKTSLMVKTLSQDQESRSQEENRGIVPGSNRVSEVTSQSLPHTSPLAVPRATSGMSQHSQSQSASMSRVNNSSCMNLAEDEQNGRYVVKECWRQVKAPKKEDPRKAFLNSKRKTRTMGVLPQEGENDLLKGLAVGSYGATKEDDSCGSKLVINPNSTGRLLWDLSSVILLSYDVVTIPLQFFRVEFPLGLQVFLSCFWTIDMICGPFVGFYDKGLLDMRLSRTVKKYVCTWCLFDITVVGIDWIMLYLDSVGGDAASRSFSSIRVIRTVRSLRLLRLVKMKKAINSVKERITSDLSRTLFNVGALIVLIVAIAHVIACCWYGLGFHMRERGHNSWLSMQTLPSNEAITFDASTRDYKYITALHWSLTQFTPASMEVVPQNTSERTFAVLVLLFAMVIFSSFVSALTSTITRFSNKHRERNHQFELLRRFLKDMSVSHFLAVRLEQYLEHIVSVRQLHVEMEDVVLLDLLSKPLRMDLDKEIYGPVLSVHPFFEIFNTKDSAAMRKVCSTCINTAHLSAGDSLFQTGEPCHHMFFVLEGTLKYHLADGQKTSGLSQSSMSAGKWAGRLAPGMTSTLGEDEQYGILNDDSIIEQGGWCCEAVLWTNWNHQGVMRACTNCKVLTVDAREFSTLTAAHAKIAHHALMYAQEFCRQLNELQDEDCLSDLPLVDMDRLICEGFDSSTAKKSIGASESTVLALGGSRGRRLSGSDPLKQSMNAITTFIDASKRFISNNNNGPQQAGKRLSMDKDFDSSFNNAAISEDVRDEDATEECGDMFDRPPEGKAPARYAESVQSKVHSC